MFLLLTFILLKLTEISRAANVLGRNSGVMSGTLLVNVLVAVRQPPLVGKSVSKYS